MKFRYPYNPLHPIHSTEDYLQRRQQASQKRDWRNREFELSLPELLISRCPFCGREIWMEGGLIFSLTDSFWYRAYSDGRGDVVTRSSFCDHLFCVDGALNLNGQRPTEARRWHDVDLGKNWNFIWMASEAPFVKPRVMALPTMVAVIHHFPVAEGRYTAYPIVYFAQTPPSINDFSMPWGAKTFMLSVGAGFMVGKRSDAQAYRFERWIETGQLFWLNTEDQDHPLIQGSINEFPYHNVAGRQHPYRITEGKVTNLRPRDRTRPAKVSFSA